MNSEYLLNGSGKIQFSFLKLRRMHSFYWLPWCVYKHIFNTWIIEKRLSKKEENPGPPSEKGFISVLRKRFLLNDYQYEALIGARRPAS